MKEIYNILMQLSQNYLELHRYILNGSMKAKDYKDTLHKLTEIEKQIKLQQPRLDKYRDSPDFDVFRDHLRNLEWMISGLKIVANGLCAKADNTGKYGFFQYRKDLKNLDETHKIFEVSGNYLNSKSLEYR